MTVSRIEVDHFFVDGGKANFDKLRLIKLLKHDSIPTLRKYFK